MKNNPFLHDLDFFMFQNFTFQKWLCLSLVDYPSWKSYWADALKERLDNLNR